MGGRRSRSPARPPLHLIRCGVLSWKAIPLRDRRQLCGLPVFCGEPAAKVRGRGRVGPLASDRCRLAAGRRQPPSLCEWLWHPLAYAALNQDPAVASAQPFRPGRCRTVWFIARGVVEACRDGAGRALCRACRAIHRGARRFCAAACARGAGSVGSAASRAGCR